MTFEYPTLLWLLALPLLLAALYVWRELSGRRPHLRVPTAAPWLQGGGTPLAVLRHLDMVVAAQDPGQEIAHVGIVIHH